MFWKVVAFGIFKAQHFPVLEYTMLLVEMWKSYRISKGKSAFQALWHLGQCLRLHLICHKVLSIKNVPSCDTNR